MNQSTHAWLAVEAYRKIAAESKTEKGKSKKLGGLEKLLGEYLKDVVVAAWLPDALIKDMTYGHVFKNSRYEGDEQKRFALTKDDLKKHITSGSLTMKAVSKIVDDSWWKDPYRVKENGGHLPARVNALCQSVRDMFRMGDADVEKLTGVKSNGADIISKSMLYSPRNIAMTLWMTSHYIADAHMPFHCDNRSLASTAKQKTHGKVEDLWGEQVAELFHSATILRADKATILNAKPPAKSHFADLNYGEGISPLKNSGDPWKEAVYICRLSFATSFALVPPTTAAVDDQKTSVRLEDILNEDFCGEKRFWMLSRAIMTDAVNSIAMFWQDAWVDFTSKKDSD